MPIQSAKVQVPGTTSNLGPGFDCLGVAFSLHNVFSIQRGDSESSDAMIVSASGAFFAATGLPPFPFRWAIEGKVPRSRGLGSSVTVRIGLVQGLNELCGLRLKKEEIFQICARLEGHPDNAASAIYGGFTAVRPDGKMARFEVDPILKFVLLIPDFETETAAARRVMPTQISIADAVFSLGNACAITAAFASQDYESLRGAFSDKIHQPYRTPLIPFLPEVLAAAENAGALGGFLSGSGSTIAAITLDNPDAVAEAMAHAAGLTVAHTRILTADNAGAQTIEILSGD